MTREEFQRWLEAYGHAWEARDADAARSIFTPDALYYWTPFGEPKRGREGIAQAWREATGRQRDVRFRCDVLSVDGDRGIAHWHTTLTRTTTGLPVRIDGVLMARMDGQGLCTEFREWWHGEEGGRPYC